MRLLIIDNYDSFPFNLYQLFAEFSLRIDVYRHDAVSLEDIATLNPDWICISPGPKDPAHAGISQDVVRSFASTVPILGVCLGMQVINEVYGGTTTCAPYPVHGKRCRIFHNGDEMFRGIPSSFHVARYHSLQCANIPKILKITAQAEDGVVMAFRHATLPVWGVQFHPESFLSEYGLELTANFLNLRAGFPSHRLPDADSSDRFPRWHHPDPTAEYFSPEGP